MGGKINYVKFHVYLTLDNGPPVHLIKILLFVASSSNKITGVWSNVLRIARSKTSLFFSLKPDECYINGFLHKILGYHRKLRCLMSTSAYIKVKHKYFI